MKVGFLINFANDFSNWHNLTNCKNIGKNDSKEGECRDIATKESAVKSSKKMKCYV